jgi:hypothetical protein
MQELSPSRLQSTWPWQRDFQKSFGKLGRISGVIKIDHVCRLTVVLVVAVLWTVMHSGAALGAVCSPPKAAAKASLELRQGDLQYVHDLDTAGIRKIVNGLQGYVAGPWHLPIGLTVADLGTSYDTKFYYRKAQSGGHCVALAEAKFSVGYDDITVYISSEYAEGTCEYNSILAHEQEHVRIDREILKAYEGKFKDALRRLLRGKKAIFAHHKGEARSAYVLELRRQLDGVVTEMAVARNLKNGAIDTQDSYRRLSAQCDNWRGSDLEASGQDARSEPAGIDKSVEATQVVPPSGAESTSEPARGGDLEGSGGDDTVAAPSESAAQGLKTEPDEVALVQQGRQLSKANAKQLESALKSLPYDFPTRARLLGFYFHKGLPMFGRAATIEARRRHVLWLIENHPESSVAGLPEAIIDPDGHELADEEGYQQAKDLWLEQAEKNKDNTAVRRNAAKFLQLHDQAIAETLL